MTEGPAQLRSALADRYTLAHEVGRGGMAVVYLAQDLRHDRPVAVKVLRPDLAASLGPERFLREIRIAARLTHPHIASVYDSGDAAGALYYVMPYLEGESLRARLGRERQLPLDDAVRLTREVAEALAYAHEAGFIHRDVKPGNILLSGGHAVVADFGLARALEAAAGEETLTVSGLGMGTPLYMSPEQADGGPVDARTDQYSLGTVLYEMLGGEPPFLGSVPQTILARKRSESAPRLRPLRDSVPEPVERVVLKALARSPADRYPTIADFATALTAASTDAGVTRVSSGSPSSATSAPSGPAPRAGWRALRVGGALIVTAAAVLVAANIGKWRAAPAAEPRIVVVPFRFVGEADREFFADGVTELITTRLAGNPGLRVVSRTSAARFRDSAGTPAIGRTLGADYVLTGTVRPATTVDGEPSLRVTPVLVRVEDNVEAWSQRYDAAIGGELFALQEDIAERIATAMHVVFDRASPNVARLRGTSDRRALEAYMIGRFLWRKRDPESLLAAQRYFGEALALDSSFALAWSGLADAILLYHTYWSRGSTADVERAIGAARRAIALDDRLAEAHGSLGLALSQGVFDWDRGAVELRRAADLDPDNAFFHLWLAYVHQVAGRFDSALSATDQALRLDPLLAAGHMTRCHFLMIRDRWDDAEAACRRTAELEPGLNPGHWGVAWAQARRGALDSAVSTMRRFRTDLPWSDRDLRLYAMALVPGAAPETLRAVVDMVRQEMPGDEFFVALLYATAGRTDSLFPVLERAAEQRNISVAIWLIWIERAVGPDSRFADVRRRFRIP